MLRSTLATVSAPTIRLISWLNRTPHATAVYASWPPSSTAHATLASGRIATTLPGPDFHRPIAPACLAPSANATYSPYSVHGCRLRGRFEPEQLPRIGWRGDDVPKDFDDLSRLLDQRGI